jgi:hypothetical protein
MFSAYSAMVSWALKLMKVHKRGGVVLQDLTPFPRKIPGRRNAAQRRANRRCAALSRSVQRPKGARLSAGLGLACSGFPFF